MKVVAGSLDSSVEADLRPVRVMVSILAGSMRPPLFAAFYALGSIAMVAIVICFPLSTFPLLLLGAWLVPFFGFAHVVIVCAYIQLGLLYGRIAVRLYQRACGRVPRPKPSAPSPRNLGVWDRWLDGAGG